MLLFGMTTSVLCIGQYALSDSILPLVIGSIGLIRSSVALLSLKHPILNTWPFLVVFLLAHTAAFVITTDWAAFMFVQALPVIGAYLGTFAVFFKRMALTKAFFIASGLSWLVYEFHSGFYTQMVGETFTLFANATALFMVLKAEKAGMPEDRFNEIDAKVVGAITGSMPVVKVREALTGSIPVIQVSTNTMPLPVV